MENGAKRVIAQACLPVARWCDPRLNRLPGMVPVDAGDWLVIDEPRAEGYYGGLVAAPAFRRIAGETALYLDVLPSRYRLAQRR